MFSNFLLYFNSILICPLLRDSDNWINRCILSIQTHRILIVIIWFDFWILYYWFHSYQLEDAILGFWCEETSFAHWLSFIGLLRRFSFLSAAFFAPFWISIIGHIFTRFHCLVSKSLFYYFPALIKFSCFMLTYFTFPLIAIFWYYIHFTNHHINYSTSSILGFTNSFCFSIQFSGFAWYQFHVLLYY